MNISNLSIGMTIKNYKELCSLVEITQYTNSTARQKQLQELSIYCNYHKEGNKFIIDSIIEKPIITLNDILKTKNSKYIKVLANTILEYLYNNPTELQQIPLTQLFTALGITNSNYKDSSNYRKELSQLYDIQLASIYYFYDNTKNEFKRVIERCLNNLQSRSVLFWSKCIMIVKGGSVTKADDKTTQLILNTQKEVLQYLKVNNMYEMMKDKHKRKEFNKLVKQELTFNYYYAYDIIIGDKAIRIEYDSVQQSKKQTNKLMIDRTNDIFSKEVFSPFKKEYDKLVELLINSDNKDKIESELKEQREYNIKKYEDEMNQLLYEQELKKKELELKYKDTF